MSLTLLVDLDDTLLSNPQERFMPAYIKLLSKHLSAHIDPALMVPQLLAATEKMISKDRPCQTLEKTFDADFYPLLGLEKSAVLPTIEDFYDNIFPSLEKIVSQRKNAISLIDCAFSKGYKVVIATNPLFPLKAIIQRLKWAGLPPEKYPFSLITSYETMHFAKPNPAYYAEILGRLGWPEQPVCMIGNNLEDDIIPAERIGIPGYYLTSSAESPRFLNPKSRFGSLDDSISWMDEMVNREPLPEFKDKEAILSILKSTPAALDTLTGTISEKEWQSRPIKGEWSVLEVICHLRDVEKEINIPRINQFINEQDPFIAGIDSDIWATERRYNSQYTPDAFVDFCSARVSILDMLANIEPNSWNKTARHSIFGPTDLVEILGFVSTHDQNHLHQVVETISSFK